MHIVSYKVYMPKYQLKVSMCIAQGGLFEQKNRSANLKNSTNTFRSKLGTKLIPQYTTN